MTVERRDGEGGIGWEGGGRGRGSEGDWKYTVGVFKLCRGQSNGGGLEVVEEWWWTGSGCEGKVVELLSSGGGGGGGW